MRRLTVMLNLFDFRVKCVSSYFSEANVTPCVLAHVVQASCALLNISQIDSMNLP